jgi:hypothetical protein
MIFESLCYVNKFNLYNNIEIINNLIFDKNTNINYRFNKISYNKKNMFIKNIIYNCDGYYLYILLGDLFNKKNHLHHFLLKLLNQYNKSIYVSLIEIIDNKLYNFFTKTQLFDISKIYDYKILINTTNINEYFQNYINIKSSLFILTIDIDNYKLRIYIFDSKSKNVYNELNNVTLYLVNNNKFENNYLLELLSHDLDYFSNVKLIFGFIYNLQFLNFCDSIFNTYNSQNINIYNPLNNIIKSTPPNSPIDVNTFKQKYDKLVIINKFIFDNCVRNQLKLEDMYNNTSSIQQNIDPFICNFYNFLDISLNEVNKIYPK